METAYNFLDPEKFNNATNLQFDLLKKDYRMKLWLFGTLLLVGGIGIGYILSQEQKLDQ